MAGVVRTSVLLSLGQGAPNRVPTAQTYKTDSEATEAEREVQTLALQAAGNPGAEL